MTGAIPPRTASPRIELTDSSRIEHKERELQLGRGHRTEAFTFSTDHIAASMAPVCTSHSGPGTLGFKKRSIEFNNRIKNMEPTEPIRTGNRDVDVPNLQRYKQQLGRYHEIEERACLIFLHNLKYRNQPSRQLTMVNAGGGGDSAEIRNQDIDASYP